MSASLAACRAVLRDRARGDDDGSAIVEFVFVALLMLVPLVYLIAAVASVQRSRLAVSEAARDAGRAYATSDSPADARLRVLTAARLAFRAQGLDDEPEVWFVPAGADCSGTRITPRLVPGAEFAVCVGRHAGIPGVPSLLTGRGITTRGEYVVHIDDYRSVDDGGAS